MKDTTTNTIKATSNTGLTIEKAFEIMDKLFITAEKADNTATIAWAGIALVASRNHIKATAVCERYGVEKSYYNMVVRGAKMLDTGKENKNGVPILGYSPYAIEKDGKKIDYTIQKLSRLSSIGDEKEIRDFISEYNITPETSQANLIKAIANYKNPKPEESKLEEANTSSESKTSVSEPIAEVERANISDEGLILNTMVKLTLELRNKIDDDKLKLQLINHMNAIVAVCQKAGMKLTEVETIELQ